jgi:hypothetical protein
VRAQTRPLPPDPVSFIAVALDYPRALGSSDCQDQKCPKRRRNPYLPLLPLLFLFLFWLKVWFFTSPSLSFLWPGDREGSLR